MNFQSQSANSADRKILESLKIFNQIAGTNSQIVHSLSAIVANQFKYANSSIPEQTLQNKNCSLPQNCPLLNRGPVKKTYSHTYVPHSPPQDMPYRRKRQTCPQRRSPPMPRQAEVQSDPARKTL